MYFEPKKNDFVVCKNYYLATQKTFDIKIFVQCKLE